MQESLVDVEQPQSLWCGCVPCEKLLMWRAEGTNRTAWKAFCSLFLIAELGYYIYYVYEAGFPLLVLFGSFTLVKYLIEAWGQDTPNWICPGGIGMFLLIYVLVIPSIIYTDGVCTTNQDMNFPYRDEIATVMFFGGSLYALSYELGRFAWKKKEENKGKLHTIGLAKYCIHPNYLGDLFTYSGWGLACGTTCALSVPIIMLWSFVVLVCPNSDAYLAQRYWREFPAYARETATLIPGVSAYWANQVLAWAAFAVGMYLGLHCAGQCGYQ